MALLRRLFITTRKTYLRFPGFSKMVFFSRKFPDRASRGRQLENPTHLLRELKMLKNVTVLHKNRVTASLFPIARSVRIGSSTSDTSLSSALRAVHIAVTCSPVAKNVYGADHEPQHFATALTQHNSELNYCHEYLIRNT